jgi:glutamate racemase
MNAERPIAVFDSGLGGLTVAAAIRTMLPQEHIIFLADRARVPYASLSPALIARFALECLEFLLEFQPKVVVIACNTVSAVALELIEKKTAVPVMGVIQPTARAAAASTKSGRIGVLATTSTVKRKAYDLEFAELLPTAQVFSNGCPLLVPLVEEGWTEGEIPQRIVEHYAEPVLREKIDTLVLGCTHYEYFRDHFQRVFGAHVHLVNTPLVTANELCRRLELFPASSGTPKAGLTQIFSTDVNDALIRVVDGLFFAAGFTHTVIEPAQVPRLPEAARAALSA